MDTTYSVNRGGRNFKWLVVVLIILLLLAGTGYFIFGANGKFISPLPETPAVEIIFYTPTHEPVTPTSSPSATPRITSRPSATPVPTKSITATPTTPPTGGPTPTSGG